MNEFSLQQSLYEVVEYESTSRNESGNVASILLRVG